jgi:predicted dinucleotide-binding enzyme
MWIAKLNSELVDRRRCPNPEVRLNPAPLAVHQRLASHRRVPDDQPLQRTGRASRSLVFEGGRTPARPLNVRSVTPHISPDPETAQADASPPPTSVRSTTIRYAPLPGIVRDSAGRTCLSYAEPTINDMQTLKIGILGAGTIGGTLARKLAAAGHDVKVANSRGPETIDAEALSTGARAVTAAEAVRGLDVVILSTPPNALNKIAPLLAPLPAETVVMDTSNYHPFRDGKIDALEAGQVESLWAVEQLGGRPIVKAWNSLVTHSLVNKGRPVGSPGRIALPVAADRERDRKIGMQLVEDTGFDAVDAGTLAESWRQQPGAPSYCTDLTRNELPAALASAERRRLAKRRNLATEVFLERFPNLGQEIPPADFVLRVHRTLFM